MLFLERARNRAAHNPALFALPALAVVIAALYCRSLTGFFQGDDFANVSITSSYDLRRWPWLFVRDVSEGIWGFSLNALRPFAALFGIIEGHLFRGHPLPYRITSLALEFINASLVFSLARRLVAPSVWLAFAAALLFVLHPTHVEPVAWIAGQSDLLPTAMFLGSLLAFLRYREDERYRDAAVCLLLGFLAIFTKENSVVLPLIFAAYDLIYRRAWPWRSRAAVAKLLTPYLFSGALLAVYFACRKIAFGSGGGMPNPRGAMQLFLEKIPTRYSEYFSHLCAPLDISAVAQWNLPAKLNLLVGFLFLFIAVPGILLALRRRDRAMHRPLLFTGGVWFAGTTLPFLLTYSSSRHLYLVTAGLCLFLAAVSRMLVTKRSSLFAVALLGLIGAGWASASLKQTALWARAGSITREFHREVGQLAGTPAGTVLIVDLPPTHYGAYTLAWSVPFVFAPPFYSPEVKHHFVAATSPPCYYAPDRWAKELPIDGLKDAAQVYLLMLDQAGLHVRTRRLDPARVRAAAEQLRERITNNPSPPFDAQWSSFTAALQ